MKLTGFTQEKCMKIFSAGVWLFTSKDWAVACLLSFAGGDNQHNTGS